MQPHRNRSIPARMIAPDESREPERDWHTLGTLRFKLLPHTLDDFGGPRVLLLIQEVPLFSLNHKISHVLSAADARTFGNMLKIAADEAEAMERRRIRRTNQTCNLKTVETIK